MIHEQTFNNTPLKLGPPPTCSSASDHLSRVLMYEQVNAPNFGTCTNQKPTMRTYLFLIVISTAFLFACSSGNPDTESPQGQAREEQKSPSVAGGSVSAIYVDQGKLSDEDLTTWSKAAKTEELTRWFNSTRQGALPPDYQAPEWLSSAADANEARKRFDEHYSALNERMRTEGRLEVIRESPVQVRQMVYDEKFMAGTNRR